MTGSNRRHSRCKRDALPTELIAPFGWAADAQAGRPRQAKKVWRSCSQQVGTPWSPRYYRCIASHRIASPPRSDRAMKTRGRSSRSGRRSNNPAPVIGALDISDAGKHKCSRATPGGVPALGRTTHRAGALMPEFTMHPRASATTLPPANPSSQCARARLTRFAMCSGQTIYLPMPPSVMVMASGLSG